MKVENNGHFTAFLYKQNGADTIKSPSTVQRIQIGYEEITSFSDLEEKLLAGFQELKNTLSEFTVYWGNEENDWMPINDETSLLSALKRTNGSICQLHVMVNPQTKHGVLKRFLNMDFGDLLLKIS